MGAPTHSKSNKCCTPGEVLLPPFTRMFDAAIAANLPNSEYVKLMQTKLVKTITEFKWRAYAKQRVQRRLLKYAIHSIVAAAAMVVSAQSDAGENE